MVPRMGKDTDDAADNVKQGLGLLLKAARKAARGVKRDVTATAVSRTIEDAGTMHRSAIPPSAPAPKSVTPPTHW